MQTRQLNKVRRLAEAATDAAINYGYNLRRANRDPSKVHEEELARSRRKMDRADLKFHRYLSTLQAKKVSK